MNKKKLFIVSDIHSFYNPLLEALDKAGFDKNNEDHYLIVCGDAFDRGPDSVDVLHFLMSLDRKILVKGNHDDMFEMLCKRGFPQYYDHSNGTVSTVEQFGGIGDNKSFEDCCDIALSRTQAYRDSLINYFETKNYIFVHGWIPVNGTNGMGYSYKENWRNCTEQEFYESRWLNGMRCSSDGVLEPGKTIVCGHWHCSYGWAEDEGYTEFGSDAKWDPYYNKGIIAIDRCTAHTGEVNVLVLEDEFL